jgi:hypothetical protein
MANTGITVVLLTYGVMLAFLTQRFQGWLFRE